MNHEEIVKRLVAAYRQELLENPPVRGLDPDKIGREGLAWALARKDVNRVVAALARAGLTLAERPSGMVTGVAEACVAMRQRELFDEAGPE